MDLVQQTVTGEAGELPVLQISAEAWSRRLEQARFRTSAHERPQILQECAPLRPQFRQLLRRIKEFASETRFKEPENSALAPYAVATVELSRLLFAELSRIETEGNAIFVPPSLLQTLLDTCTELLDRLQMQFALLDELCASATELHAFVSRLIRGSDAYGEPQRYTMLVRLVRRLLDELPDRYATLPALVPELALAKLTRLFQTPQAARVYLTGITTAAIAGRAAQSIWLRADRLELITAAALLQDCGSLILNPQYSNLDESDVEDNPTSERTRMFQQHPLVGAALLAGLPDASVALARLVAQHHERLNGTGYPRQCTATEMSDLSRLLSASVRFETLRQRYTSAAQLSGAEESGELRAARQLVREAGRREFDPQMTLKLLAPFDPTELGVDGKLAGVMQSALEPSEPTYRPSGIRRDLHGVEPLIPPAAHDRSRVGAPRGIIAGRIGTGTGPSGEWIR